MKIVIVGAGVSGLIAAISLKSKHPSDDVLVIDHNSKISKKLLHTTYYDRSDLLGGKND